MSKGIGKQLSILTSVAMVMTWSVILAEVSPPVLGQLADTPWPMFQRDPQHTGRSPYLGIQKPAKKWDFTTGNGVAASPAIGSDGTIYVGSAKNAGPGVDHPLYAINPDGTEKWNYPTKGPIESSPAIGSDGTIYVGSDDIKVYAINPDGTKKWEFSVGGDMIFSSPAIGSDGTIYIGSGSDGKLYAIGDTTAPTVPVLSSPANNSIVNTSTPTFDYQDSTDEETAVDGYQIHVDDESTFFSPVLDEYLTESQHTPSTPLEKKTHFWRVRAKDKAGNWSDWSEVWRFTVALQIIAYPNPCYADGLQTLRIANLPQGSRVHIYTISGELVRTLNDNTEVTPEDGSAIATWDLRNDTGSLVAQGVYLYFVPKATGGDRVGKIVVLKERR